MRVFSTFAFLLCSFFLKAQLSTTHYIPPISVAEGPNAQPRNQYLHISTPSEAEVSVEVNQIGGNTQLYNVSNANPLEIFIGYGNNTPLILPSTNSGSPITNKGYIIKSDRAVYVSVRMSAGNQAGSLVSKGLSGLGKNFRVGTFTNEAAPSNADDYINFVSVMAVENNTQINFSDLASGVIVENNTPLSAILNAGESYVVALNPALTDANKDGLIGALVSSDKNIAVNCGSFNGGNGSVGRRDAGFDQIAPLQTIAIEEQEYSEYIFVRANGYDAIERPLLVAHYDNTEIWINGDSSSGNLLTTLNAGEYISIEGNNFSTQSSAGSNPGGNLYVWTSKTTFAFQGIGGTNDSANQELFFVPPLNCKAPRFIDNIPLIQSSGSGDITYTGAITIVAEVGAAVNVNGVPTTTTPQTVNGNSNYVTYLISGLSGNVTVSSTGEIYVSYFGAYGSAALGGFYSGFVYKPEIISNPIDASVQELCIPFVELSLGSRNSFDVYQWFNNGTLIPGATSETYVPDSPGFYQLQGVILDCSSILSDNIPVSSCAGDYDGDGINNNLDLDLDNDGILNTLESDCNYNFDLASSSGPYFTSAVTVSSANTEAVPFEGFTDQSMLMSASPTDGAVKSFTNYRMSFNAPTNFKIEQAPATQPSGGMEDTEEYILSVPFDQTVSVYDPDNQLLIDVNYDGIYDNNINDFTAFEIRFKLNAAIQPTGAGTFYFQSQDASQFEIKYINNSEISANQVAFQLSEACRVVDTDGDSIADSFDLDSDNDGIYDLIEGGNGVLDENQDGMLDGLSTNDINLDGHHDSAQPPLDSDFDGVFDCLDLDSDNDGLYDLFEAGHGINTVDTDNNGQIDLGFNDSDSNGVSDLIETLLPLDSDNDGIADFVEQDADNDGCFDVEEAGFQGTVGVLDGTGIDENGLVVGGNGYDAATDSNADGLFDYQEFVEIIIASVTSPQFVCEADNISLEISLETNSDSYDLIAWQRSTDAGISWQPLTETPGSFENVNSNILQILNTSLGLSNNLFRAEMSRNDLVCRTFFSEPIKLIINPLPSIISNVNLFQCDTDTDGVTVFNLSEANSQISSNFLSENFSYYHFLSDAEQGNTNEITSPIEYENTNPNSAVDPNQIFVRVETAEGCALISTLNLFVSTTQVPSSFSIPPYNECYDDSDGITEFDFSESEDIILALFPPTQPISVSYYETETEALSEINEIVDVSAYQNISGTNQTIWVRLDSDIDNSCIGLGPYIELEVNPLPELNTPQDVFYCVAGPNSLNLDLNFEFDAAILGTQNSTEFSLDYYATIADAESGVGSINTISNTSNFETIFYRIFNNISGCFDIGQFEIDFINIPQANSVPTLAACETNNDGLYLFDTSALEGTVLGPQANMSVAYFDALGNPLQDANGILVSSPFPTTFLTSSQTITAVVYNGSCTDAVTNIEFLVNSNTNFSVEDTVICSGNTELIEIDLAAPFLNFNIQWTFPDSTTLTTPQPELLVSQSGEYQVSVANLNGSCEVIQTFQVFESEPPTITAADITVVEGTSNNSISIDEASLGTSNYEFQLIDENGILVAAYQDLGYFDQLSGGFYSLYVRDEFKCGEIVITVPVLYIPNFFTPNNDGFNDVWGIKGVVSGTYISSKISIFDRYGKILKTMNINENFWDGTYNGALLPTNDYWYWIELTKSDGSVFIKQGHFTLRR